MIMVTQKKNILPGGNTWEYIFLLNLFDENIIGTYTQLKYTKKIHHNRNNIYLYCLSIALQKSPYKIPMAFQKQIFLSLSPLNDRLKSNGCKKTCNDAESYKFFIGLICLFEIIPRALVAD